MGSNNGYNMVGAFGNCNGAGVIMSNPSKLGKQQMLGCHSIGVPSDDVMSLQQYHAVNSSNQPFAKDVAQVMPAQNGHGYPKSCSNMDPVSRNMIRQDIHGRAVQSQHHQFPVHQEHPMMAGNTMGGVVLNGGFVGENPMFRAQGMGAPGGMPSHPFVTSGEPVGHRELSPPSSASYGEAGGKQFGRKRSRKRPKTCGVCSDRAKSFHFGGLSCDSCKAFFRRSVQNDAHVAFRCAYDSCCDINISTRKSCQFCRFKKCLSIGMEKSWVMTEEERNALNQQRMEKKQGKPVITGPPAPAGKVQSKQQQMHQPPLSVSTASSSSSPSLPGVPEPTYTFQGSAKTPPGNSNEPSALAFQESEYTADVDKMLEYMTYEEQQEIKTVVETYLHAYKEMPFRVSFEEGKRDTLEIIEMFTTILRRFAYFSKLIPDFAALDRADQGNLLRAAVLEMCLLRGAACFDSEHNRWPSSTMESLKNCPQLRVEDMQRLVSRELFEMHITFIMHMKRLRVDEPTAMLLIMTVLFSPERVPVENKVKVNQSQEKYLMLLKKYVTWKFGSAAGNRVYPQLLTKLSDLRQLNDFHTEFHLNLDSKEVNAIKKSLEELHLNPYPNWKIVPDESRQNSSEEPQTMGPKLPMGPQAGMSMPMMTQALIQSFADRRIPTLLDNPYATFETDLSMIRQVQQALGSLIPQSGISPALISQNRHVSTDSDSNSTMTFHDALNSAGRPASISPRGYSSSTDSADVQSLDTLQSSHSLDFRSPSLGDSSRSSSAHLEGSFSGGEYHADRFQQFLQENGMTGQDTGSVIKELAASFATEQTTINPGSQHTVLRKHSSSGSSLPGTPSSVIRTAPARQAAPGVILQHTSSPEDAQAVQSINSNAASNNGGWNGGEIQATTNGHYPGNNPLAFSQARIHPNSMYNDTEFSDDD